MRFLPLWLLPLAVLAVSAPTSSESDLAQLTGETFAESTAKGVWLVEHFSPSCRHCQAFEPTWRKFVAEHAEGVNLAQVNCIVWGDVCNSNQVTGYPQIILFKDGKQIETFDQDRTLEKLQAYASQHAPSHITQQPEIAPPNLKNVNPDGEVVSLSKPTLDELISKPSPSFIKFYAPWCGHCKKLAPVFTRLAVDLRHQVNVGEVNCDKHQQLCKIHNIQGFPTLIWFAGNGAKGVEYNGKRTGEALREFAAVATKDPITTLNHPDDLVKVAKENNVVFLWTYPENDDTSLNLIKQVASTLLGTVPIVTSRSSQLRAKYHVDDASWALIVIKDGHLSEPTATLTAREYKSSSELEEFVRRHSLPSSLELDASSFQRVMNARHKPLVVVAPFDSQSRSIIEGRVKEVAKKWAAKQKSVSLISRDVIFTWMDADRWTKWLKTMYGYQLSEESIRQQRVIITDHSVLTYFDTTTTGSPLTVATSGALFSALEAILESQPDMLVLRKHSQGRLERLTVKLSNLLQGTQTYVVAHPLQTIFVVLTFFALIFIVIQRALRDDDFTQPVKEKRRLD